MIKPPSNTVKKITLAARLIVGLVFLFSGFVKLIDPVGSTLKVGDYLLAFHWSIPAGLVTSFAIFQALFEFVLGGTLVLGIQPKLSGWLVFLFML
jgi:uncharacterized membrane protein YphA (DoxX/SURF4 family)